MLKCINDDFWFIESKFTWKKRVQVDLSMSWLDARYTPIVPIENIMRILFSLSPFAIIIEYFLHSMEYAVSSIRKSQQQHQKLPQKTKWVAKYCALCVSNVIMLWMNYTWISLFFRHHFSSLVKFSSCVYRLNWTNWTLFIHINHI